MEVRIGTTLGGTPVRFDISHAGPLLLVADVGRGKTTTARYLARWWLANTARHAHVFTPAPHEWADLRGTSAHPGQLDRPVSAACHPATCLLVIDDVEAVDAEHLALLPWRTSPTVLTSYGGDGVVGRTRHHDNAVRCFGLVRPDHPDHSTSVETAVCEGQGRLDWPSDAVAVIPDQRGPIDFPCHRWETPGPRWAATCEAAR